MHRSELRSCAKKARALCAVTGISPLMAFEACWVYLTPFTKLAIPVGQVLHEMKTAIAVHPLKDGEAVAILDAYLRGKF